MGKLEQPQLCTSSPSMHYYDQKYSPPNIQMSLDPDVFDLESCSVSCQLSRSPLMKPEMKMMMGTERFMAVNTLITRADT